MEDEYEVLEEGACWWCGSPADSREHKLKRSDLVREYGQPPYTGPRTLTYYSGSNKRDFQGPKSPLVKFEPSLCARCNGARSQPFDRAWDLLTAYLVENEEDILACKTIDLEAVFGEDWNAEGLNVARYLVKHLVCRVVQEVQGPTGIDPTLMAFLDDGAYPEYLNLDFRLDEGVRDLLRITRARPCPEDPAAAEAGFLAMSNLWVLLDPQSGQWSEPQGGLHYRWLAVYWKTGAPEPSASFQPGEAKVVLRPCDGFFGLKGRQAFALALSTA